MKTLKLLALALAFSAPTLSALTLSTLTLSTLTPASALAQAPGDAAARQIERGRYLIKVGGCNDCHTAGYGLSNGRIPEQEWLKGDPLGWQGPWGTTYASNLRLYFSRLSENEWLEQARTMQTRPPMPWFTLHDMQAGDLRAIYAFMRKLGPAGEPAPVYVPPGQPVQGPVVKFPG
ncbi:MAG: cytochrome C [Lautropia sp.]